MLHQKSDDILKGLPKVFDIADDIVIVGYDAESRDHDKTMRCIMQVCQQEQLKLNKN